MLFRSALSLAYSALSLPPDRKIWPAKALRRATGGVRLIGFITEPATVRQILAHVGEPTTAPAIAPARSLPVGANAQQLIAAEAVEATPNWSLTRRQT